MGKTPNLTVIATLCILLLGVLALVLMSGACSPRGGGTSTGSVYEANSSPAGNTATGVVSDTPSQAEEEALDKLGQKISELEGARPAGNNTRDVASSSTSQNDSSVCDEFESRGFDANQIVVNTTMDGTTVDPTLVSRDSGERHPSYMYVYASTNNITWIVYVNDGKYSAVPRVYNGSNPFNKQMILSENDTITQYDSANNTYSDFNITELEGVLGIRVDRIDAQLLDSYTVEQLEVL